MKDEDIYKLSKTDLNALMTINQFNLGDGFEVRTKLYGHPCLVLARGDGDEDNDEIFLIDDYVGDLSLAMNIMIENKISVTAPHLRDDWWTASVSVFRHSHTDRSGPLIGENAYFGFYSESPAIAIIVTKLKMDGVL